MSSKLESKPGSFGSDVSFLRRHTRVVLLSDAKEHAQLVVVPAWQGRVMTSTATGADGRSFGWINRPLIAGGKRQPHINAFGGEDRFWLGPEGGQFSLFFAPGAKFQLSDWFTPAAIDTMPYRVVRRSNAAVALQAKFQLRNYSGAIFDVAVRREVRLLPAQAIPRRLGIRAGSQVATVAYESVNEIQNVGREAWRQESGNLSIWILGMFQPSPTTIVVVPIRPGPVAKLGPRVNADYFGAIPADRLVVRPSAIFFRGDGNFRSKIGVNPQRSRAVLGSYDDSNRTLTIVQFDQPKGVTDYVNSQWAHQDEPYKGDAANSYNDGPPAPGVKPLGPFYELESSSPAAALLPGQVLTHLHRTIHLTGDAARLDLVAKRILGVSLDQMRRALPAARRPPGAS